MSKVEDYVPVEVEKIGFLDEQGIEGVIVLTSLSDRRKKLTIRAFSGETATHMDRFSKGDRSSLPTIYNIVEDVAERNGQHLARVQIYSSNTVLRGDITFEGRSDHTILQGYRASDCLALAILYDSPILVQSSLLVAEEPTP
jgi:hypothetical protein